MRSLPPRADAAAAAAADAAVAAAAAAADDDDEVEVNVVDLQSSVEAWDRVSSNDCVCGIIEYQLGFAVKASTTLGTPD